MGTTSATTIDSTIVLQTDAVTREQILEKLDLFAYTIQLIHPGVKQIRLLSAELREIRITLL